MKRSERTCCICRSKGSKRDLIRLVVQGGRLVIDDHQNLPGRGGYVHATVDCLSRMGQVGRWERALRLPGASLEALQVSRVAMELLSRASGVAELSEGGDAQKRAAKKVRL